VRQPGILERTMGSGGGFGGSLLSSFAMGFVGSMVAQSFFSAMGGFGSDGGESHGAADPEASGDESTLADNEAGDDGFDDGGGFDDFDV